MSLRDNIRYTRPRGNLKPISIFIFCEGTKREVNYFKRFHELDSRLKLIIFGGEDGANTPKNLFKHAKKKINEFREDSTFLLREDDLVWLVFDTDPDDYNSREQQISELITEIDELNKGSQAEKWNFAESNPCFEVWLHYHFSSKEPDFDGFENQCNWKEYIHNLLISEGGYNEKKHPFLIVDAIENIKDYQILPNSRPSPGLTTVDHLAENIISVLNDKILDRRRNLF